MLSTSTTSMKNLKPQLKLYKLECHRLMKTKRRKFLSRLVNLVLIRI